MKKFLILSAVSLLALPVVDTYASTDSATGTATVEIIGTAGLSKGEDLRFGKVIKGDHKVTVGTDNTRTSTNEGKLTGSSSEYGAGTFNITGTPGTSYTITIPSTFTVGTMIVNDIKVDLGNGAVDVTGAALQGQLPPQGTDEITQTIKVGATLNVTNDASVTFGEHSGTYEVSLSY